MTNKLYQIFSSMSHNIDDDLDHLVFLKNLCNQFKIKLSWVFLAFITLFIFFTLIGLFEHVFVTAFGIIYPAYMSLKMINQNNDDKQKQWISYWVIFGLLTAFDGLFFVLLFFLPAYYSFKTLFFLWLFYPRTNGAKIIYQKFLKQQLKSFDQMLKDLKPQ